MKTVPGVPWGFFIYALSVYFCGIMLRYAHFQWLMVILFVLVLGSTLALTVFLVNTPHTEFIQLLVLVYQIPEKTGVLANTYLTSNRYEFLKYTAVAGCMTVPVAGLFLFIHLEYLYRQTWGGYRFIRSLGRRLAFFKLLTPAQRTSWWLVLLGLLFIRAYAAWYVPVHTDEAYSFLFVVDHGLLATLSYYPGPNNHVAFSLCCALLSKTGIHPLWAMRIPALLVSLLFCWVISAILMRRAGFHQGMLALLFFSFTGLGWFYSFHGRGYYLVALCAALALLAVWKYAKGGKSEYLLVFALASVLGMYTIPVFLFPFVTWLVFAAYLVFRHGTTHRALAIFVASVGVAVAVGMLYIPIVLFNGWEALFANQWVAPMPRSHFKEALPGYAFEWLSVGYPNLAVGLLVKVVALGSWLVAARVAAGKGASSCWLQPLQGLGIRQEPSNGDLKVISDVPVLLVCTYLVAGGMVVFLGVLPPGRVWIYLIMLESVLAILGLYGCVQYFLLRQHGTQKYRRLFTYFAYAGMAFWAIFQSVTYMKAVENPANPYHDFRAVATAIQRQPGRQFLIDHSLYHVLLGFECRVKGQKIWIEGAPVKGARYDYAILRKGSPLKPLLFPEYYEAVLENRDITLYRLKR